MVLSVVSTSYHLRAAGWCSEKGFADFGIVNMGRLSPFNRDIAGQLFTNVGHGSDSRDSVQLSLLGWCWKWTSQHIFSCCSCKAVESDHGEQPAERFLVWRVLQPELLWYTKKSCQVTAYVALWKSGCYLQKHCLI